MSSKKVCAGCGAEAKFAVQKFCVSCGSPLNSDTPKSAPATFGTSGSKSRRVVAGRFQGDLTDVSAKIAQNRRMFEQTVVDEEKKASAYQIRSMGAKPASARNLLQDAQKKREDEEARRKKVEDETRKKQEELDSRRRQLEEKKMELERKRIQQQQEEEENKLRLERQEMLDLLEQEEKKRRQEEQQRIQNEKANLQKLAENERRKAEEEISIKEELERRRQEELAIKRKEEEEKRKREEEERKRKRVEEEKQRMAIEEQKRKIAEEERKRVSAEAEKKKKEEAAERERKLQEAEEREKKLLEAARAISVPTTLRAAEPQATPSVPAKKKTHSRIVRKSSSKMTALDVEGLEQPKKTNVGAKWAANMFAKGDEDSEAARQVIRDRRAKAVKHTDDEIRKLITEIQQLSQRSGHPTPSSIQGAICPSVKFGDLFNDTMARMSELSATLMSAKNKRVISYQGMMLAQGFDDDVLITLMKSEIKDSSVFKSIRVARPREEAPTGPVSCDRCKKTVYTTEKLLVNKNVFHKTCFKCTLCTKTITVSSYSFVDGNYFCKPCFLKEFNKSAGLNFGKK